MDEKTRDKWLIQNLGGPSKVAELLGLKKLGGQQRVQNWLERGIPSAVKVLRPDLFMPELAQASVQPAQAATQTIASTAEPAVVKIVCREAEGVVIGPEQRTHAPRQYQDPARDRRVHPDGVV